MCSAAWTTLYIKQETLQSWLSVAMILWFELNLEVKLIGLQYLVWCDEFNLHHSHQIYLLYFFEITISRETRKLVINTVVNRTKLPTNLNVVGINLLIFINLLF